MKLSARILLLAGLAASAISHAERLPVLQQIDLPHPYYFREMYLPQLTSGPSSLAWSPDSSELIYSMAGSLWRQKIAVATGAATGSAAAAAAAGGVAQQLTAGSYDYQPDWSPDGRWVIYSSYRNDAMELWILDLGSGVAKPLAGERRGQCRTAILARRQAHSFCVDAVQQALPYFHRGYREGRLSNVERLTGEHKSELPRYYYSLYDHEINPVWTRDGREIIYVSNRNHIYGTGGFWRTPSRAASPAAAADTAADAGAREIHYEETNWKARPDVSPDGTRMVYSSYLGRPWHNLWVMPAGGGDAFPIGYGDWDQTYPRWSPDGTPRRVHFQPKRQHGHWHRARSRRRRRNHWASASATICRRWRACMSNSRMRRAGQPPRASASPMPPAVSMRRPAPGSTRTIPSIAASGTSRLIIFMRAARHGSTCRRVPPAWRSCTVSSVQFERRQVTMTAGQTATLAVNLDEGTWSVPDAAHWVSADVHVHMNYGGEYRNTPAHLATQAQAENLTLVNSLIVNKEQRFPDIAYSGMQKDPASQPDALIVHGQEYHTSYWGHLGLLDISGGVILPGYVGYPNTAAASSVSDECRRGGYGARPRRVGGLRASLR